MLSYLEKYPTITILLQKYQKDQKNIFGEIQSITTSMHHTLCNIDFKVIKLILFKNRTILLFSIKWANSQMVGL
jgi:hypothetical protein